MWVHIYCKLLTSLGSNAISSKSAKTIERDSTQTTYVSAAAARKVKFSNGVSDLDYSAFVLTIWYSASNEWRQGFNLCTYLCLTTKFKTEEELIIPLGH